jgi:succinate-semialdehyde dehydrogenase / glutarate-semialdehyde dehydrogenase
MPTVHSMSPAAAVAPAAQGAALPREAGQLPAGRRLRSPHVGDALLRWLASLAVTATGSPRESIDVELPYTGEVLGRVPRATEADVAEAVRRARAAQPAWARVGFAEKRRIFLRFHDLLLDREAEILDLIQLEAGKARLDAFEEVGDTAWVARHYAFHAARLLRPRRVRGAFPLVTPTMVYRHPVGVVGIIAPWNYPLVLAVTDAVPALMAGNAVVLKPDHQTSFTALWAAALLYEAGLPADVLPVVTGEGVEIGPALIERVDFVMFTGSTRTGKVIARQAAERLIGCSLELGGKNPAIVLPDADLGRTVEGVLRGCFAAAGQLCVSTERIYVHHAVYDEFITRLAARARRLRMGAELSFTVDVGSLSSAAQLERVEAHVADAVAKGATVLAGGRRRPDLGPYFSEPTLVTGVTHGMRMHAEETFGPVAAIHRFETIDDAVALANATSYGLNASVWTRDERLGREVARRVQAGTVNINETYAPTWSSVRAPIGGMKESGLGRRHGDEGILKYTEPQTVSAQRLVPINVPVGDALRGQVRLLRAAVRLVRRVPGLR